MIQNKKMKRIWAWLLCLCLLTGGLSVFADQTLPEAGPQVGSSETEPQSEESTEETLPAEESTEDPAETEAPAESDPVLTQEELTVLEFLKMRDQASNTQEAVAVITGRSYDNTSDNYEESLLRSMRLRKLAELRQQNVIVFRGTGSVNVREEATAASARLGKMYYNTTATVLDNVYAEDGLWYHIQSGEMEGYVKAEFFVSGYEAAEIISGIVTTYATIKNDAQRLYRSADTGSDTLASLYSGMKYEVESQGTYFTRLLYASGETGDIYGYVPNDCIELSWELRTAVSKEVEEQSAHAAREAVWLMNSLDNSRAESVSRSIAESIWESQQASIAESIRRVLEAESRSRAQSLYESSVAESKYRAWKASSEEASRQASLDASRAAAAAENDRNYGSWIPAGTSTLRRNIVMNALQYVGVLDYVWGWEDLNRGADCSGFIKAIYAQYGIYLPHSSYSIARMGVKVVSITQARPGDIICYNTDNPSAGLGHVSIYIGQRPDGAYMIVEAPTTGLKVRVNTIDWTKSITIQNVLGD